MRESRTAIGINPIPDVIIREFVQKLSPYRKRNTQVNQLGFFIVASSVRAKSPLLRETPAELENAGHTVDFMHDMLFLASRHVRTEEVLQTIRSGSFMRYFHFLVGIGSLSEYLKVSFTSLAGWC